MAVAVAEQLEGIRFRRQHPVEPYILDFQCWEQKLAIELDGSQHYDDEAVAYDARRTAFLAGQGIRALRFPNEAVFKYADDVACLESVSKLMLIVPNGGRGA